MIFQLKAFDELTLHEFHAIVRLRINVFVVEQNCPYEELDTKDKKALHLFAYHKDKPDAIIAYTRIFRPGDYYEEASFGRVVVHADYRKQQFGYELIQKTIDTIEETIQSSIIKIGAQTYLKKFYESFGFKQVGDAYIEDGIPHIHMIRHQDS